MNKQYFEKLNTEKLAELKKQNELQKFEFSIIDDFEKEYNNAAKIHTEGMRFTTAIDNAAQKVLDLYDQAGKSYLKANARYQEIENAAKDLGIEIPSKIEALKDDISESLKDIDKYSKNLLKIKNTDFL